MRNQKNNTTSYTPSQSESEKLYVRYFDAFGTCALDDNSFYDMVSAEEHARFVGTFPTVACVQIVKVVPVSTVVVK